MSEFHEVITHIPLQYFDMIDEITILIIEDKNEILREIEKYQIDKKNITQINSINLHHNLHVHKQYDIIIIEKDYNLNFDYIEKIMKSTKILIIPQQTQNYYYNILSYFVKNTDTFNVKYSDVITIDNKKINYYSNEINPHKYFVSFSNFYKKNIQTLYYKPDIHFRYLNINDIIMKTDTTVMGVHIMLDFAEVSFELLENTTYIKDLLNNIAVSENFVILNTIEHKFEPQGYTLIFMLSTSHFTIHTYPEFNKCSIDLYSCDLKVNYNNIIVKLKDGLKSDNFILHQVIRKI